MNLTIESLGGNCPVQGYGTVDGRIWYFRARGRVWCWEVWREGVRWQADDALGFHDLPDDDPALAIRGVGYRLPRRSRGPKSGEEFDCGWMPPEQCEAIIRAAAATWAQLRAAEVLPP